MIPQNDETTTHIQNGLYSSMAFSTFTIHIHYMNDLLDDYWHFQQKRMILVWISALTGNLSEGCDVIFKKIQSLERLSALPGARWRGSGPDSLLIRRPELPALKQSSEIVLYLHDSK
jgi:hypothetical protein